MTLIVIADHKLHYRTITTARAKLSYPDHSSHTLTTCTTHVVIVLQEASWNDLGIIGCLKTVKSINSSTISSDRCPTTCLSDASSHQPNLRMCRYCYTNEETSIKSRHLKRKYYRHPYFGLFCRIIHDPNRKVEVISNWLALLPAKAMMLIILFTEQYSIPHVISQCDRKLYDLLEEDEYWHALCKEWFDQMMNNRYLQPYEEDICDNIDMVMPNTPCSDTWKGYYLLCSKKVSWLSAMKRKVKELSSFLPLYGRLMNQNFGSSRIFSKKHNIYIVSDPVLLDYQLLESSIYRTAPVVERSISSSVVLSLQLIHKESEVGKSSDSMIIISLTMIDQSSSISYQHFAEAMIELSKHDSRINMNSQIALPNPSFIMPYEVYAIIR
jgi:hypothetical protein